MFCAHVLANNSLQRLVFRATAEAERSSRDVSHPAPVSVAIKAVVVRKYRKHDLEAVVALFGRSVRQIAGRDYDKQQIAVWAPEYPDMDAWAARLGSGTVLVAEEGERMVGFARLDEEQHIDLLYVDPLSERRGVAKRLVEELTEIVKERGVRKLHADVSVTARPFFEAQGFEVMESQLVERRGVVLKNFHMVRTERDGDLGV